MVRTLRVALRLQDGEADMIESITIVIPGRPQGKATARSNPKSRRPYTPARTRSYEASIGRLAAVAMRGKPLLSGPLHLDLRAHFEIPKSWTKAKKQAALVGGLFPTGRPDNTNIAKAVEDGCMQIVFKDDAAIVSHNLSKVYAAGEPFVVATIKPICSSRVPETTQENAHERPADRPQPSN